MRRKQEELGKTRKPRNQSIETQSQHTLVSGEVRLPVRACAADMADACEDASLLSAGGAEAAEEDLIKKEVLHAAEGDIDEFNDDDYNDDEVAGPLQSQ